MTFAVILNNHMAVDYCGLKNEWTGKEWTKVAKDFPASVSRVKLIDLTIRWIFFYLFDLQIYEE